MNKTLKKTLKFLSILIGIIIFAGIGIWWYINSTFLDFEDGYEEKMDIAEITSDGYSFLDRNGNKLKTRSLNKLKTKLTSCRH